MKLTESTERIKKMKTLKDYFGKTEAELLAEGWIINGLAIYRGRGAFAKGDGAYAKGRGAFAKGVMARAVGDGAFAKDKDAYAEGDWAMAIGDGVGFVSIGGKNEKNN